MLDRLARFDRGRISKGLQSRAVLLPQSQPGVMALHESSRGLLVGKLDVSADTGALSERGRDLLTTPLDTNKNCMLIID